MPLFALAAAVALAAACPSPASSTGGPGDARISTRDHVAMPLPPPTRGERAARFALGEVGIPYRWGGESPTSGFDCSGLVRWAYLRVGVELPHSSFALYDEGRTIARSRLEPGDLLFFEGLGHVALYAGGGRMVHAPQTGRNVEVVSLAGTSYGARLIGARRVVVS